MTVFGSNDVWNGSNKCPSITLGVLLGPRDEDQVKNDGKVCETNVSTKERVNEKVNFINFLTSYRNLGDKTALNCGCKSLEPVYDTHKNPRTFYNLTKPFSKTLLNVQSIDQLFMSKGLLWLLDYRWQKNVNVILLRSTTLMESLRCFLSTLLTLAPPKVSDYQASDLTVSKRKLNILKSTSWKFNLLVHHNVRLTLCANAVHKVVTHLKEHCNSLPVTIRKLNEQPIFDEPYLLTAKPVQHDERSSLLVTRARLMRSGDVETNPGPKEAAIKVISYNVRGLNDERKLRHLINHCYKLNQEAGKNCDSFYFFQETYINEAGKIPYLWRGNYFLTNGQGNSLGCLTLLSSHLSVLSSEEIDSRAHILVCESSSDRSAKYLIANVYAPCPNSQGKIAFLEQIFNKIDDLMVMHNNVKVIMAGDFNLNLSACEMKNRNYSAQERRVADIMRMKIENLGLRDVLSSSSRSTKLYTWRRPNTDMFSTIDRVVISADRFDILQVKTDWSISLSDHAAVIVNLGLKNEVPTKRVRLTRLDPALMACEESRAKIESELKSMLDQAGDDWNPHLKLEYAKMCIRTISEKVKAESKKKELAEEEEINLELNLAVTSLERTNDNEEKLDLIDYIEELRGRKQLLIDKKGERLAQKLKSKWYNEGEKSTRYFLRLLNRQTPDDMNSLVNSNGEEITSKSEIEKEVVKFYKDLYEDFNANNLVSQNDEDIDDFFNKIDPVSGADAEKVSEEITLEELARTLKTCNDSAPGPDGIPYAYYKGLWTLVSPILINAWNHTVRTGNLAISHKVSYLKLIPKSGKNLKLLTNWRPITLSNCDHKLITKTYANRMCAAVAGSISERQTAYIKGRLINDNIRAMLATIALSNSEEDIDGLLISLDAKKAFDSVSHEYIVLCLKKFGLESFVPIFRILYSDLNSDIILNGAIVKGYKIKRGVKQGDALSCILFIMCMEPMLRNLEANERIVSITTVALGVLPKAYAYADDVNATIKNDPRAVQEVFNEYARLTRLSGLELNADKTEIMRIASHRKTNVQDREINLNVRYLGITYNVSTKEKIKINGILFQQDADALVDENVEAALVKVNNILKSWSARHLSILGKILISKTFGISQIIYLMQSVELRESHIKMINSVLFKFLWNRHFTAAKAPERIKREIMYTPIKEGGFGMLDLMQLDKGIKIKGMGRLYESKHPFMKLIKDKTNFQSFFLPNQSCTADGFSKSALKYLTSVRLNLLKESSLIGHRALIGLIRNTKVVDFLNNNGRRSILYFNLRIRGKTKICNLAAEDLRAINRFIDPDILPMLRAAVTGNVIIHPEEDLGIMIGYKGTLVDIRKLSSKEIRNSISKSEPICIYKIGMILTPNEALTWGESLRKMASIKHKSFILRVAHGDVYTKEKLYRYGLNPNPECPRCGHIETLHHKFVSCEYVSKIWDYTINLTNQLKPVSPITNQELRENNIMGSSITTEPLILSIHSEILTRIMYLKDDQNFLLHPKHFTGYAIKNLIQCEKRRDVRSKLENLISQ